MFRRPALYHPYKSSAPSSPAGFRLADYIQKQCFNLFQGPGFTDPSSPDPSPLNSPVKGVSHPGDDAPPTIRLADLFEGGGFGSPKRPSTPTPDHHRNAMPNVRTQDPLPTPPRRKVKYGSRQFSFKNDAHRSGVFPPHRRAQQRKEKRDALRQRLFDRHEHRMARARDGISRLQREAEVLMKPERMDDEDRIFLEQLGNLQFEQKLDHDLEECRRRMARAGNEAEERRREHKARDKEAAKMWGEKQDEEALEEQKRKVEEFVRGIEERKEAHRRRAEEAMMLADEKRRRAHEAVERKIREEQERRFREELTRNAKQEEERRGQEEQDRRLREGMERQLRDERERRLREEVERVRRVERERRLREEQERKLREEVDRLRREAHERFLREERERQAREERDRQARLRAEQARRASQDDQARQYFVLYEAKWNELRTSKSLPPIDVLEMPWPVFGAVSSADQITYQDVRTFLFHPLRPGVEGKTARDKVKSEVLRFHPDKFNTRIVPKVQLYQQTVAQEIAGAIARILTTIMTEELEQQK